MDDFREPPDRAPAPARSRDHGPSSPDLGNVVGSTVERVALLAARSGRWSIAGAAVAELQRRGLGPEVVAEVAELAAAAGAWEVAEVALGGATSSGKSA
ncbi:MAG TPA: hypothetical protein PLU22_14665 [Polyangiaceae bacterium]|nr:hypothetical protein [Polyangiaceae bacterium]